MKVKCLYNDPSNVGEGIPNDFDYGLEINKEYNRMNCLLIGLFGLIRIISILITEI